MILVGKAIYSHDKKCYPLTSKSVDELRSGKRRDHVVELGCGTGFNFPLLMEKIGPESRLIGINIILGMLDEARKKIELSGWKNIELIQSDIAL